MRAAIGSGGVYLLHSRQAPRFPGHRGPTSGVFSSPRSAYLRSALSQSYLGAKGREPAVRQAENSFLLSSPGLCVWVLILVWLSPMSRSDLRKRPREGQSGCVQLPPLPPPSLPVILPALPFGVASAPGRSHVPPTPPCISPSFSLHSAPPRDVRFQNGLAFPWLGMTAGWVGVAWPAWPSRRERTRWRLHKQAVPKVRGAGDVGVGRRFRPSGHPAQPVCP